MRVARGMLVVLMLLLPLTSSAKDRSFIRSLQIRGSGRRVALATHAGQGLDRTRLQADVERLWATGRFEDVRVEANETPEGVDLVITLAEKPRLYLRRLVFEPDRERRALNLRPGDPVDAVLARRVAAALRRQLAAEGYADAEVDAELVPAGFQEADLHLSVEPGPRTTIEAVRFAGNPGLPAEELRRALRSTRVRKLFAWRLRPPFSREGVEDDLLRLRSLYLAHGYFEARIALAGVEFAGEKATVTLAVDSGPLYRVRWAELAGDENSEELAPGVEGRLPERALCRSLLAARRRAETEGAVDFAARLEVARAEPPPWAGLVGAPGSEEDWVGLVGRSEPGELYTVGRIEFRGNHHYSDLTLRRAWTLDEGEVFDLGELRRSLARLNQTGYFEPVAEDGVTAGRDPARRRVNLTVWLQEVPRGRWTLGGPLLPTPQRGAGPLQFSAASRLPAWGRGPLELSTYFGSVSLIAFALPAAGAFSLAPQTRWLPLVALERPVVPGQRWQSGFLVAPQLSWRGLLAGYGLSHARQAAEEALAGDPAEAAELTVPVAWASGEDEPASARRPLGHLYCEAPRPRLAWLRAAGSMALNFLLARPPL